MPYDIKGILKRAVPAYKEGARIADLASRFKISRPYMYQLLRDAGVDIRAMGVDRRKVFDEEAAVEAYLSGTSILELAGTYKIARGSILNRLKKRNVKIRSASEQAYISASRQSPEERKARAAAAHAAVRGQKQPHLYRVKCAINRQRRCKQTAKEIAWQTHLWDAGIPTVAQYAVDRYSVDLAIPDVRIAIEVKSGWSTGRLEKGQEEARKKAVLRSLGWVMIDMYGSQWRPVWVEKVRAYVGQRQKLRLA